MLDERGPAKGCRVTRLSCYSTQPVLYRVNKDSAGSRGLCVPHRIQIDKKRSGQARPKYMSTGNPSVVPLFRLSFISRGEGYFEVLARALLNSSDDKRAAMAACGWDLQPAEGH